jgi:hypothetical protein
MFTFNHDAESRGDHSPSRGARFEYSSPGTGAVFTFVVSSHH